MSALPPKADMCSATRHVRYGPIADMTAYLSRAAKSEFLKLLFRFTSSGGTQISHSDWPEGRNNVPLDPPINCGNDATRERAEVQIHRHQSDNDPGRVWVLARAGHEHLPKRLARLGQRGNYAMHHLHRANLAARVAGRQIAARPRSVEQR